MPKIIDVILHKTGYGEQIFVVVDEMPKLVYKRYPPNFFIANDGGFYDFLAGDGAKGEAFAGREFTIRLDDGTDFECRGNVWSSGHGGHVTERVVQVGVSTVADLAKCHVYSGGMVSAALIDAWLAENKPSRNYRKYDKRQTIEWLDSVITTGSRPVCADRARTLRKRGVKIFRDADGGRSWSPSYERMRRAIIKQKELDA